MPAFGIKLADANIWLAFAADGHLQLVTFDHGFRRFAGLDLLVLDT